MLLLLVALNHLIGTDTPAAIIVTLSAVSAQQVLEGAQQSRHVRRIHRNDTLLASDVFCEFSKSKNPPEFQILFAVFPNLIEWAIFPPICPIAEVEMFDQSR